MREKGDQDPIWRYSDEESFLELKNRANFFLEYASGLDKENILAVSHEYFIKAILSLMMHGQDLTYKDFRALFYFFKMENTSVTICKLKENKWRFVSLLNFNLPFFA